MGIIVATAQPFVVSGTSTHTGVTHQTNATTVIMTGIAADLTASCTAGTFAVDTGGATKEMCWCFATDTWYCAAIDDTTGPAD